MKTPHSGYDAEWKYAMVYVYPVSNDFRNFGTRKAEVLNSLIINTTAKANDTTDILQTFR